MTPQQALHHAEVADYLTRFWRAMDACDYASVVAGLSPACRWLRGAWREGHAAILASLEARPPLAASRHCIVNMTLTPEGNGDANAYVCDYGLVIFGHPADIGSAGPPFRTSGPRMGDWTARLERGASGRWLAHEIRATLMFDRA